jgi:hypothetical protein
MSNYILIIPKLKIALPHETKIGILGIRKSKLRILIYLI